MQICSGCSSFMQGAGCFDSHVKPNGLMHGSIVQTMEVLNMSLVKPMGLLHMSLVKPMGLMNTSLLCQKDMIWVVASNQTCIM